MSRVELRLEFDKYDSNHNEHLGRSEFKRFHDDHHAPKITLFHAGSTPDDVQPTVEVAQQAREAPMLAQSCAPVTPGAIETSQSQPLVSLPAWHGSQQAGLSAHCEEASLQWKPQQVAGTSIANADLVMQSREQPQRQFVRHEPRQPAKAIVTSELTFLGLGASSDSEQVKPEICLAHLEARQDSESEDLDLPTPVESPRNVRSSSEPAQTRGLDHLESNKDNPDDHSAPASRWTNFVI